MSKITTEDVYKSLEQVMDPEIPVLNVVELGMITSVSMTDNGAEVHMIPTFAACPAVTYIQKNIREKLEADLHISVTVIVDKHIAWESNRISPEAKEKLSAFGIAPPRKVVNGVSEELFVAVPCPHCGSTDTYLRAPFGSTLCRAIHFCKSCGQIFEHFKPLD
ncbi:ring-1,2-phenylacetyl-CoA epoxidase subunit PaaD [Chitinophaga dinghuensis]|uniref:Ring-1,2-phenylacetyl-CoA epoxidase subunit PaaD n=1 Tax=Chitinophaga dinghuensis TaxID=1539050 RepID=A0A327W810_9BACT|nr:1,2-phenylacetyl-CoA epoxidase subunit PaaD [Chitinophaga dinghuensis]RAJ85513.1 ring-1,2-phenylacetyl-CoA epoxidase subunit PaaD [Chitinophaga dinghuensis]